MAKQFEEFLDEDDCCMNCGVDHFKESKVSGLCLECYNGKAEEEAKDSYGLYKQRFVQFL